MGPENAGYILTPSEYGSEMVLTTPSHRGKALARALAVRVARGGPTAGQHYRYYFTPERAKNWLKLFDGGWHVVRRNGQVRFTREPRPVELAEALRRCGV